MRKTYTGLEMNNLDIHNIDKDKIIEKLSTMLKPNRLQHSINVATVSYTHLDVYKRQICR